MMNEKITLLKGPDRVRKRPAVIFGSDGVDGAEAAVRSLLDLFATEAMLGHCTTLSVNHNEDDICISCDDRGIYLGQDLADWESVWKQVFCELYPEPKFGPSEDARHFSLFEHHHGLLYREENGQESVFLPDTSGCNDLCMLQFACAQMDVTVVRDNLRSELHFRRGYPTADIRRGPASGKTGTTIRLKLDADVFTETALAQAFFREILQIYAMLVPGLTVSYTCVPAGETTKFLIPGGIGEAARILADSTYAPVFTGELTAAGKDRYNRRKYCATVKAALCFVPKGGDRYCYHNLRTLKYGGTHVREMEERICREVNACFRSYLEEKTGQPGMEICPEELMTHCLLIVETRCSRFATAWESGARQSICNVMIRDMAQDLFGQDFSNYLHGHKETLCGLIDQILAERNG